MASSRNRTNVPIQQLTTLQVFILGFNFPESRLVKVTSLSSPEYTLTPTDPQKKKKKSRNHSDWLQSALRSFYGVGYQHTQRLMAKLYIHPTAKVGTLTDKQVLDLTAELSSMTIENDLRRKLQENIKRLRDMGTERGRRHAMGLPVRGQRTRTQVRRLSMACFFLGADMTVWADFNCIEAEQIGKIWIAGVMSSDCIYDGASIYPGVIIFNSGESRAIQRDPVLSLIIELSHNEDPTSKGSDCC